VNEHQEKYYRKALTKAIIKLHGAGFENDFYLIGTHHLIWSKADMVFCLSDVRVKIIIDIRMSPRHNPLYILALETDSGVKGILSRLVDIPCDLLIETSGESDPNEGT